MLDPPDGDILIESPPVPLDCSRLKLLLCLGQRDLALALSDLHARLGRFRGEGGVAGLLCRRPPKETKEYYHYIVHEKGDWKAAEQAIAKRTAGGSQSIPPERMQQMKVRFISGGGTFPVIGSYDEVAATFKRIADAGIGGMAIRAGELRPGNAGAARRGAAASGAAGAALLNREERYNGKPESHIGVLETTTARAG
jgi:hypothetical protein